MVTTLFRIRASPTGACVGIMDDCLLSRALCPFHNQYSSSLLLPRSFRPMADLPRGLLLPWIQENISEGKGRQLLTHTKKEPSVEILPALSRTPSATACLQRDSLPIKLNFIKGS